MTTFSVRLLFSITEIRHPEELSLCKPVEEEHLKINYGDFKQQEEKKRRVTLGSMPHNGHAPHHTPYHSHLDVSAPIVERPDTNTFVANSATLGRKISNLSWTGSPASKFRSLGRNGTFDRNGTPTRRRSES